MKAIFLFLFVFVSTSLWSQKNDKFYLVDTSDFYQLASWERVLLDTSLERFHEMQLNMESLKLLNKMYLSMNDNDVWINYSRLIDSLAVKLNLRETDSSFFWETRLGTISNEAYYFGYKGDQKKAIKMYEKLLVLNKEKGTTTLVINTLSNLGSTYESLGEISKAIESYYEAIELMKDIDDHRVKTNIYNNLALLFDSQKLFEKALHYYRLSYSSAKKIKEKRLIAVVPYNLGSAHEHLNNLDSAIHYYKKSLGYSKANELYNMEGYGHRYVGRYYLKTNNLDSAEWHLIKSIDIANKLNDPFLKVPGLSLLASIYEKGMQYDKAIAYASEAIKLSDEISAEAYKLSPLSTLAIAYENKKDFKKALKYYKRATTFGDSLQNSNFREQMKLNDLEVSYKYQIQMDSIQNAKKDILRKNEIKQKEKELRINQQQRYLLFGGIGLSLALLVLAIRNILTTRKANKEISRQKKEADFQRKIVQEKNKEILDSITYAKRIQSAILPPLDELKKAFPKSFVFYQAKDIVAGDFYWFEENSKGKFLAAADCTGHGVPGAMVSVVCNSGLNRSVREYGLSKPGEILDKTRELVIKEFEKSEKEVKDGMDIALVRIHGDKLFYAGAHNPIWIIRDGEIIQIKADKMPIGKHHLMHSFQTHEFTLKRGDRFYLFSDGFPDQFGGAGKLEHGGKKYKSSRFKKFLLSIQNQDINSHAELLKKEFETWKGPFEQLDDVCVLGVEIEL